MINNLSKEPPIFYIGTVVKFENQKEQVTGLGWGWRYKVATFDAYSSQEAEISDADIEYAIALLGTTDGSGASDFRKSPRIAQGDIVLVGKFGGKRGISIIMGVFPRTRDTIFGEGRFDSKTGYFGSQQAKGLFGVKQEFNDRGGHLTPETTPRCSNKDKSVPAKKDEEKFKELGLGDAENTIGQLEKPPVKNQAEQAPTDDASDQNDVGNSGFTTPVATDLPNELPPPPTYDELPVGSQIPGTTAGGIDGKVLTEPQSRYPGGPRYQLVSSGNDGSGTEVRWIDNPRDPKFDAARAAAGEPPRSTTPPPGGSLW